MFSYFRSPQCSFLKITAFGDSLFRGLQEHLPSYSFYEELDLHLEWDVNFFPGATLSSLRNQIFEFKDDFQFSNIILIHIGTNNLENSVWEIDSKLYLQLYYTVRERFPSADIVFSLILPRWDCDDLYLKSRYYNNNLFRLFEHFHNCYILDATELFVTNCNFYCNDGLHLTPRGKATLAKQFSSLICKIVYKQNFKHHPNPRIPKELKILTPRRCRPPKQPLQPVLTEKDRALAKYIKREKYGKPYRRTLQKKPSPKKKYRYAKKTLQHVMLPPPPKQYVPETGKLKLMPYITLGGSSTPWRSQVSQGQVPLPTPISPYISRRKKAKQKKRRRRRMKRKRKRKKVTIVCLKMIYLKCICTSTWKYIYSSICTFVLINLFVCVCVNIINDTNLHVI